MLLNIKYQVFLILLLDKPLAKHDTALFSTNKSFYTMTGLLQEKELIESRVIDGKGTKLYSLTFRGEIIAMALENIVTSAEVKTIKKYLRSDF